MINLLRADFFRVIRTKIVYISLIVAVILPFFMNGFTYLMNVAALSGIPAEIDSAEIDSAESLRKSLIDAGDSFFNGTFSPLMSFSFVFAVFPVIAIMMDFGNGTIRNKVIHGYSRHQIFAAHFIVSLLYALLLTALFVGTNVLCSTCMLGISEIPAEMVSTYVAYFLIGFLGVLLIASIGSGLALSLTNAGAIVLTIFAVLFFNYAGIILDFILKWQGVENTKYVLSLFPSYFTETLSSSMNSGTVPNLEPILYVEAVLGVLIVSGGFYALGTFVFSKKDFK